MNAQLDRKSALASIVKSLIRRLDLLIEGLSSSLGNATKLEAAGYDKSSEMKSG